MLPPAAYQSGDPLAPKPRMTSAPKVPVPLPVPNRTAGRGMPALTRQRQAPTKGQLLRRRLAVLGLKWLLPGTAVVLLAAIALWPEFDRAEDRGRLSFRRLTSALPDAMRVVNPRYDGVDELQRPYTVTASVAAQQGSDQNIVALTAPRADIALNGGDWVFLESDDGRFFRNTNILDLWGRVTLFHDNGTTMLTERAHIQINPGTAEGDAPVAAQGPFGTLVSEGFRLTDRGAVVLFTGRARTVLEGSR